jgi:hypothetical protein
VASRSFRAQCFLRAAGYGCSYEDKNYTAEPECSRDASHVSSSPCLVGKVFMVFSKRHR